MTILEYLEDKGITYHTRGKNVTRGWVNISCPFCTERSNHCGIDLERGYNCWVCNAHHHNHIPLVQELEGCSYQEAKRILQTEEDDAYFSQLAQIKTNVEKTIKHPVLYPPNNYCIRYLKKRLPHHDPQELIKKFKLQWGGPGGYFKYRIVAPVTLNKKIVAYYGRDITDLSPLRYKNWPIKYSMLDIKTCLHNIDSVKDKAIVVEGMFDVANGGDGFVGTFGKDWSIEQARLLINKRIKKVIIAYDKGAMKEAKELANYLSGVIYDVSVISLDKKDPALLNLEEIEWLRNV